MTNIICIVAFREHHSFSGFKHMMVPVFGANAELRLHGVLHHRASGRTWKLEGADYCSGAVGYLGNIWRVLFLAQLKETWKGYADG